MYNADGEPIITGIMNRIAAALGGAIGKLQAHMHGQTSQSLNDLRVFLSHVTRSLLQLLHDRIASVYDIGSDIIWVGTAATVFTNRVCKLAFDVATCYQSLEFATASRMRHQNSLVDFLKTAGISVEPIKVSYVEDVQG
jgi:hypothetical protein